MKEVIGEVLLDHVPLIAATDNEIVNTILGIELQDMPENWPAPNLHHRFRPDRGLFTQTRTQATRENDCFHRSPLSIRDLVNEKRSYTDATGPLKYDPSETQDLMVIIIMPGSNEGRYSEQNGMILVTLAYDG